MKTVEINLYSFNELSEEAKQRAINNYRNEDHEIHWTSENRQTLEKFAEVFPIKITNWSYGGRGEGVSFYFTSSDEIENLSGQRLATYIWNNYGKDIFKGKFYGSLKTNEFIKHSRIKSSVGKFANGNRFNPYYSAITLDNSCVLTGYYIDDEILEPIYTFLEKPRNITFKELLGECFDSWIEACNKDVEYQNSDEYISEELQNNNYEGEVFTEDGEFNG